MANSIFYEGGVAFYLVLFVFAAFFFAPQAGAESEDKNARVDAFVIDWRTFERSFV